MTALSNLAREVREDLAAALQRDPAARSVGRVEMLLTYRGVQALLSHRVSHALYGAGVPQLPRVLSYLTTAVTGVEIHPAARIGRGLFIDHGVGVVIGETAEVGDGLFIDHGSGVVIGETAEIGENVTIYQGVTLGGTGFATGKRHPTVQDNVTIGSGAKLLGPITVGHRAKVGANTVVIEDVPVDSTVVGNPGHPVRIEGRRPEGPDADWVHLPDPIADAIKQLSRRIADLERELAARDGREEPEIGEVVPLRNVRGPNPAGG